MAEKEIGFTNEAVPTFYFDKDALRIQPYSVCRVQFGKAGRAYYRWLQEGNEEVLTLYASLTTAMQQSLPMPTQLLDWYIGLGKEEATRQAETSAHYGTMMHEQIAKYSVNHEFDFSYENVQDVINRYCESHDSFFQPEVAYKWPRALQEDMAAWIQFEADVSLKVLAVELVLTSTTGFGTAIDIVADAYISEYGPTGELLKSGPNKGEQKMGKVPQKRRVLINMKSGRKGIYDSHRIQLEFEKRIFEENFPDIKIDYIYNWAPNDWETDKPTYKLVDQTGKTSEKEFRAILDLAQVRFTDKLPDKKYVSIFGKYSQGNELSSNIKVSTLIEKLTNKRLKQIQPSIFDETE